MNIALLGVFSQNNIADRAMLASTIQLLKGTFPDSCISCHTVYPTRDLLANHHLFQVAIENKCPVLPSILPTRKLISTEQGISTAWLICYLARGWLLLFGLLVARLKAGFLLGHNLERKALSDISSADLVIYSGGYYFADLVGGPSGLIYAFIQLYPLILAIIFRRPFILLGISIGPFRGKLVRWLVKIILSRAGHIFVRESSSQEFLMTTGIAPAKLTVVPDLAFNIEPEILNIEAASQSDKASYSPKVAVVVKSPFPEAQKESRHERYFQIIATLCDYIAESRDAYIFLIPHTIKTSDDDTRGLREVWQLMKRRERAEILPYNTSPQYLKAFYQSMDIVISSRLHGIVLSRPAPVLAIPVYGLGIKNRADKPFAGYKLRGTMKLLELEQYCVAEEALNLEELKRVTNKVWTQKSAIRAQQAEMMKRFYLRFEEASNELKASFRKRNTMI